MADAALSEGRHQLLGPTMTKPQGTPRPDPMAREVDRLLAGLAGRGAEPDSDQPTRSGAQRSPSAPRRAPRPRTRTDAITRGDLLALWARVGLGAAFGVMITQWPYVHACGLPLLQYLGAVAMVGVAGGWIAVASWSRRHAPSHVLALLLILWGVALAAYEILPRVGYAALRWNWQC
jgi:hypothetical protein